MDRKSGRPLVIKTASAGRVAHDDSGSGSLPDAELPAREDDAIAPTSAGGVWSKTQGPSSEPRQTKGRHPPDKTSRSPDRETNKAGV